MTLSECPGCFLGEPRTLPASGTPRHSHRSVSRIEVSAGASHTGKNFTVLSTALKAAAASRLIARNEASLVANRPQAPAQSGENRNCWTADDAADFLYVAKKAGPQAAALWTLALDSGMRKGELAGLMWADVDLVAGRIQVRQQLLENGAEPTFIPTKGKRSRTIDIAAETIDLLKAQKTHQAALNMRYRLTYRDLGLVFAKEPADGGRQDPRLFGTPLQVNNIGERAFATLIEAADVPRITIHGLRHTSASLMLAAGCHRTSCSNASVTRTSRRRWTSMPTFSPANSVTRRAV